MKSKHCPVCRTPVRGRQDKIFCSPKCKSAYQYERRLEKEQTFLKIDRQLKTNRKLLKKYNLNGYTTLRKQVLNSAGFNPKYFTHYWKNQKGQVYLFCYDFGFLQIEQKGVQKYLLVEWQDYMK